MDKLFKVETFTDQREYYESLQFHDGDIHIFPVSSLSNIIKEKSKGFNSSNIGIFSYSAFEKALFPEWNSPYTDIYLRSIIRRLLRKHSAAQLLPQMEERIQEALLSIRFLVEMQIPHLPNSKDLNEEQKVFSKVLREITQDSIVRGYITSIGDLNQNYVDEKINITSKGVIFVYQLDYVDATRMMLFQWLHKAGFEIVFRVPFHTDHITIYKGWKQIYETISQIRAENWEMVQNSKLDNGKKFACYLDGNHQHKSHESDLLSVQTLQFDHPLEFKKYVARNENENTLAIPVDDLNRHIGSNQSNHFFSTPYGKFLLNLFECKLQENEISLQYQTYIDFMTSGWVEVNNISGMRGASLLLDLKPYMEGIKTIGDIKNRLESLIELQEVSKTFDQLAKDQTGQNRVKRYLANPFRAFAYVHQHRYALTVKQLLDLTNDLEKKLKSLIIPKGESRNVKDYIYQINEIFSNVKRNWPEEVSLTFKKNMNFSIPEKWNFEQEEIHQLIILNLGEEQKYSQPIEAFAQIRGKILEDIPLHLTDLSMHSFPEHERTLPYFLSHTWIKESIQRLFNSANKEIRLKAMLVDYCTRQNGESFSVYNLYTALASYQGKLTLSWIKNLMDNDNESIYFSLIHQLYSNGDKIEEYKNEDNTDLIWEEPEDKEESNINLTPLKGEIPSLYWLDNDFCYRKFFYSALLSHQPIYESDFHQQLVFGTLGSLFSQQGDGRKDFEETIFPLFPQWTYTLKRNLIDVEYKKELRNYKHFQNVSYPYAMDQLQRLRSRYEVTKRHKIRNQYKEDRFKESEAIREIVDSINADQIKAEPGTHCRMCPHLHVCSEGEYVIDE